MTTPTSAPFVAELVPAFHRADPQVETKTVEAANVVRVRDLYAALADGDFDALSAVLHPNVELEVHGSKISVFVGRWQGRTAVIEIVRKHRDQVEEQIAEVVEVVAQGDSVVVVGRARGRHRWTGQRYDVCWVHVFSLQNGLVTRCRQISDSLSFLTSILR